MSSPLVISTQLIDDCRNGKQEAFNQVYKTCARGVYNAIWRIVRNDVEAEDLLQETFISAFTSLENYRGDASLFGWIKRIGVNKSLNAIKKNKLTVVDVEISEQNIVEDESDTWQDAPLEVSQIKSKMELLPEGFRLVLTLYLFEEYSHKEIASALGISESTSKTQYIRGKKKLRELLMYN